MLHIYLIHPHILISIILSPTTPPDPSLSTGPLSRVFEGRGGGGCEYPIGSRDVCTLFLPFHGLKPKIRISSD